MTNIFTAPPVTWTNDAPIANGNTFNLEIRDKFNNIITNVVDKTTAQTLTNKTLTSPVINSPTGIVKANVGLGNVDNTSDATKNAAAVTLTNKTLISPVIAVPMCRVYRSIDQATYTGEQTIIVFDLEDIDTNTMHSLVTNPSRITINTAGTYLIGYSCSFQVRGAGRRLANLVKNSTALSFSQSEAALSTEGAHILSSSLLIPLALGDVIELNIYQTSDGYINIIGGTGASSTCMWATRISP